MGGSGQFIPALSGIRAIAALTVLVAHSSGSFIPKWPAYYSGTLGVMLFFVLSGFLMGHLYLGREFSILSLGAYARARIGRVYPLFAATVLLSAVAFALDVRFPFRMGALESIRHLLLIGDMRTLWTISVEFQFYLAFLIVWWLHANLRGAADIWASLICSALIFVLLLLDVPDGRIHLPLYAPYFLSGVLTSIVYRQLSRSSAVPIFGILLPALLFIYVLCLPLTAIDGLTEVERYESPGFIALSAAIVLAAASAKGRFADMIGSRPLVYLGEISFGIYLLHRPVFYVWRDLFAIQLPWPILFVMVVASVIAVAHLANVLIERPAREAFRRTNVSATSAVTRPV